jgi:hypothetical protein
MKDSKGLLLEYLPWLARLSIAPACSRLLASPRIWSHDGSKFGHNRNQWHANPQSSRNLHLV